MTTTDLAEVAGKGKGPIKGVETVAIRGEFDVAADPAPL